MAEPEAPRSEAVPDDPERRRFLARLSLGLSALVGVLLGVPILGYLLAPLTNQPQPRWIDIGSADQFPPGTTTLHSFTDPSSLPYAGLTADTAVYVQHRASGEFVVFAVNCTHLGCPVNWLPTAELFLCPCHGGIYYADGSVAAGPPPRPLYTYTSRLEGGHLYVQTQPLPPAKPWRLPGIFRPPGAQAQP